MSAKDKQNRTHRSRDFRHDPFKVLKGFAAAGKTAPPSSAPASSSGSPEDDGELFRRATSGARPIQGEIAPTGKPSPAAGQETAEPDQQLFLDAMRTAGAEQLPHVRDEEDTEDRGRRSQSSRMRRLAKGEMRIGRELDLHGYLRDEAVRRLEHFIGSAAAQGLQAVLLITGKGTNSPEGPVLRAAAAEWLAGPGRKLVAEFHPAPRDKGGSGAFVVFLRQRSAGAGKGGA